MRKILILLALLTFGCELKKEAVGVANDLIVFTSTEDRIFTSKLIDNFFNSKGRYCPQFEPYLNVKIKTFNDLEEFHKHRNLLFLSLETPIDTTMDKFLTKFNHVIESKNPVFVSKDLYAYNQVVSGIKAVDPIHFETILDTNLNWIHNQYLIQIEDDIWKKEVKKIKNYELIDIAKSWFDLEIPISMDYIEVKKDSLSNFFWIGRVYPYRWITIHEIDLPSQTKPEIYWEKFDSLIVNTMENVEISEHYRDHHINQKINKKVLTGVYGQIEANTGGPFVSYIFENKSKKKAYFLTGYINNPGKSKILMVKELELIFEHSNFITY